LKKGVENILWIFAFLVVGITWLAGLFIDTTGDSGLYSAIVRQMVESGDWFNLKINGQPYDQKPHLFFWLAGIGVQLFGNTNFAFKLFPFLYGLLGIYFAYRLGRQLFSEMAGRFSALVTGTSQIFFLYFFDMHTDLVLQTGVTLALWQLAAYFQNRKSQNFVLAFLGIGLAMLSKGPVGAVLPFLTVLIYLLAEKDFRQIFHLKWILGILIVLVVISPSLLHLYKSFGLSGLKFYFISNNLGRITGEVAGSSTDYIFYLHTFLWAFLPWTPVVILALVKMAKTRLAGFCNKNFATAMLGSVLVFLLILSVAKGKAPNYFLITVPVFSVFAGWWLADFIQVEQKKQLQVFRFYLVFAGLYTLFFSFVIWFSGNRTLVLPFTVLFISGLCLLAVAKSKEPRFSILIAFLVLVTSALNLFLNVKVFPELATFQGGTQVVKLFETNKKPGDKLYNFELDDYNLFFYSTGNTENIEKWEELYATMEKPGSWIYTNEIKYNDIMAMEYSIDTVYCIKQRGMNQVTLKFLNPATRENALTTNYLIVTGRKKAELKPD
jgi:4-amino-4-deoxy-L-arabinose transferase-like glycosyltransferase